MKKFLLSLITLVLAHTASAQILDFDFMPPYKLGVSAGLNLPSFSANHFGLSYGLHAGVDLMIDGSELLYDTHFRVQLKYSMKGATGKNQGYKVTTDQFTACNVYYTTHYIELPVHYGYSWRLDKDWSLLAETGPYVAFGLGGTERLEEMPFSSRSPFFDDNHASRFDFGWGVQAGLLFDQLWMFNIGYDRGFRNLTSRFLQNNNISVGVTYFIE